MRYYRPKVIFGVAKKGRAFFLEASVRMPDGTIYHRSNKVPAAVANNSEELQAMKREVTESIIYSPEHEVVLFPLSWRKK